MTLEEQEQRAREAMRNGSRWHMEIVLDTEDFEKLGVAIDAIAEFAISQGDDWDVHVSAMLKRPVWSDADDEIVQGE